MVKYCLFFFVIFLMSSFLSASSAHYVEDWPQKKSEKNLIRDPFGQGEYLSSVFTSWIDKNEVGTVLEIGSRDCIDALDLSEYYRTHVYAFEPNPEAIEICKHNIGENPNITLVPLAAWNETTILTFHPTCQGGQVINLGASSVFEFDPNGPGKGTVKQKEARVSATRIDEWMKKENISSVDLICIDAQGATLEIVQGLGSELSKIKYIIAECDLKSFYLGENLYPEIVNFLQQHGFTPVTQMDHIGLYSDVLFIRNELLH